MECIKESRVTKRPVLWTLNVYLPKKLWETKNLQKKPKWEVMDQILITYIISTCTGTICRFDKNPEKLLRPPSFGLKFSPWNWISSKFQAHHHLPHAPQGHRRQFPGARSAQYDPPRQLRAAPPAAVGARDGYEGACGWMWLMWISRFNNPGNSQGILNPGSG